MIRVAAPPLVLVAAAATCTIFVVAAVAGRGSDWMLALLSVVAFLTGRASGRSAGALAFGLLLAGVAASQVIAFEDGSIVPAIMLPITLYLAGLALRSREALAERLGDQAAELEAERDAYSRLSVRYERARIASELHDVVAHAISMMVVQATAGQRLLARDPARAAETFDIIATASRQAEAELDRLADLLAQDAAVDRDATLELIDDIVETARASGLPVALHVSGDTSDVSGAVAHAALRVVQEALTNALRYAPGAAVHVAVAARPTALELSITNGRSTVPRRLELGSRRGLTGLRERLAAYGGSLEAGPDANGGWSLRAWIPLPPVRP